MEKSFIIAGFGGQGVMVMGQLLSYTACETTEKYVTYFPSYGAEMRGELLCGHIGRPGRRTESVAGGLRRGAQ